jgi:hypothetical protein
MANKSPTNADLGVKLDAALQEIKNMSNRLVAIEQWKLAEDAYKAALLQVRAEDRETKTNRLKSDEGKAWLNILKQAGIILGIVAAILYAYAAQRGIGQ